MCHRRGYRDYSRRLDLDRLLERFDREAIDYPIAAAVTEEFRLALECTGVRDVGIALVGGVLGG